MHKGWTLCAQCAKQPPWAGHPSIYIGDTPMASSCAAAFLVVRRPCPNGQNMRANSSLSSNGRIGFIWWFLLGDHWITTVSSRELQNFVFKH